MAWKLYRQGLGVIFMPQVLLRNEFFDLEEARVLTVIPDNADKASSSPAAQSSAEARARARTSSLSSSPTTSTTSTSTSETAAVPPPLTAPASLTATPLAAKSNGTNSTNEGLAAGLGLTLGFAFVGGLLFGLYKWDQKRRMKKRPHSFKRSPAADAISLPTPLVETNGHMEWEMATNANTHEAPSQAQTRRTPRIYI
ncbi:MAG: hypothetical protein L6R40_006345 [Gallowayella cf. fulva]|nr:MAG: hypothetical protein L6R40_006345 [Xanthomendoza cf. fulva]